MIRKNDRGTYIIDSSELKIKNINGKEARSTCPLCSASRHHPQDTSLAVDITTGAAICHHCHEHFFVTDYAATLKEKYHPAPRKNNEERNIAELIYPLDDTCSKYLAARNLDPAVATDAGVGCRYIGGVPYLAFPFYENGTVVNAQYKCADGKNKKFHFEEGCRIIPWNIDCITKGDGTAPLYITEGMTDALALMQSGYWNVVSVPNGAGSRMEVFDMYRGMIRRNFTHIIFAGDTDDAGIKLRDKVKEYFKGTDVGVVRWKWRDVDVKDANAMLEATGNTEAVAACIRNAVFDDRTGYTMAQDDGSGMWELFRKERPSGRGIGLKDLDAIIRYQPGYMYVISGFPGTGKSTFINYVTMSLLHLYGWRPLFYSPEKTPEASHLGELAEIITGKSFYEMMDDTDMRLAIEYLSGNVFHMRDTIDKEHAFNPNDLDCILRVAHTIVERHGVKVFVIDPFMYLKIDNLHGVSETTRITEMLMTIRTFARDNNVVMLVVAHPRKPNLCAGHPSLTEMMYEIAGSSGFYNTCDAGIFLERPDANDTHLKVSCCKSRNTHICKVGTAEITYSDTCGRYFAPGTCSTASFKPWTDAPLLFRREDVSTYESDAPF